MDSVHQVSRFAVSLIGTLNYARTCFGLPISAEGSFTGFA